MPMLPLEKIPTPKSERWKYTNLPRALKDKSLAPATLGWPKNVALLNQFAPGAVQYKDTALWDLNVEHSRDVKIIAADETVDVAAQDGQWLSPRLVVYNTKENQEITLIERQTGAGAYWKNQIVQIALSGNAKLRHYRFFDESEQGVSTIFTHVVMHDNCTYEAFNFIEGAGTIRNQIHAELQGENGQCLLGGINLLRGAQHADTTITIEHQAPRCHSNQTYKSVLDDKSRCVFQGKVHVHQIAQKTDGYQLSNALLLSPEAEMDTKPELEIYADDVKCSHGATTGKLDDAPLFYMRARGIPEAQARALLIEAFCGEAVERISDESVRETVREKVHQWLMSKA
jgi:Fe-S cluster assembly protein SufD